MRGVLPQHNGELLSTVGLPPPMKATIDALVQVQPTIKFRALCNILYEPRDGINDQPSARVAPPQLLLQPPSEKLLPTLPGKTIAELRQNMREWAREYVAMMKNPGGYTKVHGQNAWDFDTMMDYLLPASSPSGR